MRTWTRVANVWRIARIDSAIRKIVDTLIDLDGTDEDTIAIWKAVQGLTDAMQPLRRIRPNRPF